MEDCRRFLETGTRVGEVLASLHHNVPDEWEGLLPGSMMQALGTESRIYLADYWVLVLYHLAWGGRLPYRCGADYHVGGDIEPPPFCLTSRLPVDIVQASADALTLFIEARPEFVWDHRELAYIPVRRAPRALEEASSTDRDSKAAVGNRVDERRQMEGHKSDSQVAERPITAHAEQAIASEGRSVQRSGTSDNHRDQSQDTGEGITVTEAASLLIDVVCGLDLSKAKARVSKAATMGEFKTNGLARDRRRIDLDSFNTWRFVQRQRDLDAADDGGL